MCLKIVLNKNGTYTNLNKFDWKMGLMKKKYES